jgi:hypothetical protein
MACVRKKASGANNYIKGKVYTCYDMHITLVCDSIIDKTIRT